ncbi:MAG: SpoIIIAH-like family protein [Acutalibacteraceae bacterium]
MVVRKRQIIAAALVLALGSAVFINWYYNRPSVKSANAKPSVEAVDNTGGNLGDAQLVNSSGVSESAVATGKSSDYFASAKLRRNSAHDKASETLNKVIKDSSSDASAVKEATAALKALSNAIKLEGDIEALIKAKTGGDCVVIINNNSAEVIVAKGALNDTVILQIKEIVLKQTGFSAENITIVELSS